MKVEPDWDVEMHLPDGKTCDDCIRSRRCFAFGFSKTGREWCDFWPNRFADKERKAGMSVLSVISVTMLYFGTFETTAGYMSNCLSLAEYIRSSPLIISAECRAIP